MQLEDVARDNLWPDSAMGDSGSLVGGGVYYRGLSCVKWAKFR